ncbi:class A beta-lactamase-related serine hydrolase [Alteriqipengyuania lutimaris]|uniref:Class A beta-lactamase-related serine hydrolase n=2 Tax=Alteriqipengyuania lutimaris TaxID=1538146 RepID=A0A395LPM6_9SPHN|nr:class A beta-lactamase-related serine hydrolase [Alteriqipengyuania lutimaris]
MAHAAGTFTDARNFLEGEMAKAAIPGVAFALVEEGRIAAGQRGIKRLGNEAPIADDTAFLIGSISKSFTALAIMQLVEAGEIKLDAHVSDYLDEFVPGTRAGRTTIRQLLSHTSGYSTFQGNRWADNGGTEDDALARRVTAIAAIDPATGPGERWEYSNINYMLLGRIVEVKSGLSFAEYLATRIFEPAGMANTFVPVTADDARLATGHTPWFTGKRALQRNPSGLAGAPAGGVASTAGDIATYLQLMMNREDDILSARGKEAMMEPASELSPAYGFGWFLNPAEGIVGHSGSNPGYESLATMVPAQHKAAVTLTNAGSGFAIAHGYSLQYGFADRALGIEEDPGLPGLWALPLYLYLVLSPPIYVAAMLWSAFRSSTIRQKKASIAGRFSLWFPLMATIAQAAILLLAMPRIFGAPLDAIRAFQPDVWWALMATAVLGVLWAVARLGIAYLGGDRPSPGVSASPAV